MPAQTEISRTLPSRSARGRAVLPPWWSPSHAAAAVSPPARPFLFCRHRLLPQDLPKRAKYNPAPELFSKNPSTSYEAEDSPSARRGQPRQHRVTKLAPPRRAGGTLPAFRGTMVIW